VNTNNLFYWLHWLFFLKIKSSNSSISQKALHPDQASLLTLFTPQEVSQGTLLVKKTQTESQSGLAQGRCRHNIHVIYIPKQNSTGFWIIWEIVLTINTEKSEILTQNKQWKLHLNVTIVKEESPQKHAFLFVQYSELIDLPHTGYVAYWQQCDFKQ
jgi:hypothetical protein